MSKRLLKDALIFTVGGFAYAGVELLWRQRTHWSMILTGGICVLSLYKLYTRYPRLSIPEKCVLGSLVITAIEFTVGCVVNLHFGLNVWDYSRLPLNILGQVCLLYSVLWGILCIPVAFVCRCINKKIIKIA